MYNKENSLSLHRYSSTSSRSTFFCFFLFLSLVLLFYHFSCSGFFLVFVSFWFFVFAFAFNKGITSMTDFLFFSVRHGRDYGRDTFVQWCQTVTVSLSSLLCQLEWSRANSTSRKNECICCCCCCCCRCSLPRVAQIRARGGNVFAL